jgi:protein-S-isoprenylcysteine O-methyltransferase Ste14
VVIGRRWIVGDFFNVKARWEGSMLRAKFPEYSDYARRTPRFVPRVLRNR